MNRRTAIRKALSLGAAAASIPVLAKLAEASEHERMFGRCAPPEAATPPPPDTRTPEQVIADQDLEMTRDVIAGLQREPSPWSKRWVSYLPSAQFDRVVAALHAQRIIVEERKIDGKDTIISLVNGNLVQRNAQLVYFS